MVTEQEIFLPTYTRKVDRVITKPETQLTYDAYTKISQLAPFGAGNPEPIFRLDGLRITRRWVSGPEGRHLRLRLRIYGTQFHGTYFRAGSQIESFSEGTLVNVIFSLELAWNPPAGEGRKDVWLKIVDMQVVG